MTLWTVIELTIDDSPPDIALRRHNNATTSRDWRPVLQMLDHNQLGASKFDDRLRPSSSRHCVRIAGFI
jgi:hypothetical protein